MLTIQNFRSNLNRAFPFLRKLAQYDISYRTQITTARNAWRNGIVRNLTRKTYKNGIIGGFLRQLNIGSNARHTSRDALDFLHLNLLPKLREEIHDSIYNLIREIQSTILEGFDFDNEGECPC